MKFLGSHVVRVSAYTPPPVNPLKIFVRGIADSSTDDLIFFYMECAASVSPVEVIRGLSPGTAMIKFETPPGIYKNI